jgi:monothiol glutaredoxin
MLTPKLKEQIEKLISQYRVMLFMKWTPESPQCGFSTNAVAILVEEGIYFESFDIYSDEDIRQWLKEYSSWPTFPQLYIDWELIWGVDILSEMYETGELGEFKNSKWL